MRSCSPSGSIWYRTRSSPSPSWLSTSLGMFLHSRRCDTDRVADLATFAIMYDSHFGTSSALNEGGECTFGYTDPTLYYGEISYINMPSGSLTYWIIPLDAMIVDDTLVTLAANTVAAIDTGTTLIVSSAARSTVIKAVRLTLAFLVSAPLDRTRRRRQGDSLTDPRRTRCRRRTLRLPFVYIYLLPYSSETSTDRVPPLLQPATQPSPSPSSSAEPPTPCPPPTCPEACTPPAQQNASPPSPPQTWELDRP